MGLLIWLASNHTKCVSLRNQKCMIQPARINLHPNEYSQEFHYDPYSVKLDRWVESCNTLNDLSNEVYVPNKTEDLRLSVFNMITWLQEQINGKHQQSIYHVNVNVDLMEENVIQISGGKMVNVNVSVKNLIYVKKIVWNPATWNCENGK